jgi:hypothetical protein
MTVFQDGKSADGVNITQGGGLTDEQLEKILKASQSGLLEGLGDVIEGKLKDAMRNMPRGGSGEESTEWMSDDAKKKLAEAMIAQRGENQSNFEGLGKVKETKKDSEDVKRTIDLLSDLED